jgi:hypothetical protein
VGLSFLLLHLEPETDEDAWLLSPMSSFALVAFICAAAAPAGSPYLGIPLGSEHSGRARGGFGAYKKAFGVPVAPTDCKLSPWSPWAPCNAPCGAHSVLGGGVEGGHRHRYRHVIFAAAHGGKACGAQKQRKACTAADCPHDCRLAPWVVSPCSASCGPGKTLRSRKVLARPAHGGKSCGPQLEMRPCRGTHAGCPVDCRMAQWGAWSVCSATCVRQNYLVVSTGPQRWRRRTILHAARNGGAACPTVKSVKSCNNFACPVNCEFTQWGAWSKCSATCGEGHRTKARRVAAQPLHGGLACPSVLTEDTPCRTGVLCPTDCQLSSWGPWGACSSNCGLGLKHRRRDEVQSAMRGGKPCTMAERQDSKYCELEPCSSKNIRLPVHGGKPAAAAATAHSAHKVPCAASPWGAWQACSTDCGRGTQTRSRTITNIKKCDCRVHLDDGSGWRRLSGLPQAGEPASGFLDNGDGLREVNGMGFLGQPCPKLSGARECSRGCARHKARMEVVASALRRPHPPAPTPPPTRRQSTAAPAVRGAVRAGGATTAAAAATAAVAGAQRSLVPAWLLALPLVVAALVLVQRQQSAPQVGASGAGDGGGASTEERASLMQSSEIADAVKLLAASTTELGPRAGQGERGAGESGTGESGAGGGGGDAGSPASAATESTAAVLAAEGNYDDMEKLLKSWSASQ